MKNLSPWGDYILGGCGAWAKSWRNGSLDLQGEDNITKQKSEYETQTQEMLTMGNNETRLGKWPRRVCTWGWGQQEIKLEGELGAGLEILAEETELYPVHITDPWGSNASFKLKGGSSKDSRADGGAENLWPFQKFIISLSRALPCLFLHPLSFKDI